MLDNDLLHDVGVVLFVIDGFLWILADFIQSLFEEFSDRLVELLHVQDFVCLDKSDGLNEEEKATPWEMKHEVARNQGNDVVNEAFI